MNIPDRNQNESQEENKLSFAPVITATNRLSQFLEDNHHLFTLVGVFGAISVYLTQISNQGEKARLSGKVGAVLALLLTGLISIVILSNLLQQIKIFKTYTNKTTKGLFLTFGVLFYSLFGMIFNITLEFGEAWNALIPLFSMMLSLVTLHMIANLFHTSFYNNRTVVSIERSYLLGGLLLAVVCSGILSILVYNDLLIINQLLSKTQQNL
ncbi:hypothetical protein [Natrinema versiforme]|uniref:hypothetical protein n=1 Tax=Natrinema versiforme TaxID=88724 RepID=UPI0012694913|nr:hypothetical protein [Natrinema versiforme]